MAQLQFRATNEQSVTMSVTRIITAKRVAAAIAFGGALSLSMLLFIWPHLEEYRQGALVMSALNGNTGRMKLLLAIGADANEFECKNPRCWTPLIAAAAANQTETAQLLLSRGADVNKRLKRGQSALMFASYHGDTEMVRLLISSGADVNADCEGDTALSWAKEKGHSEIVQLLLAGGATR